MVPTGVIRPPWDRRRVALAACLAVGFVAVVWAWRHLEMSLGGIVQGAADVSSLLGRMLPPSFPALGRTVDLAIETFFVALLGTTLAAGLSIPIAFLAARNTTTGRVGYGAARAVIAVCRAVPDLVFAAIFVRSVGIGLLPGVLAVALHSIGMIGKLFADAVEQVAEGPRDAVRSVGAGRVQELATSVIPQALPSWISTFLYRLDINVRTSVVLGLVGAGGIGFALQTSLRGLAYDEALGIVTVIAVLVIVVELFSAALRRRLLGDDVLISGAPRRRGVGARLVGAVGRDRTGSASIRGAAPARPPFDLSTVRPPWTSDRRHKALLLGVLVATIGWAFVSTEISPAELVGGMPDIFRAAGKLFPPSLGGLTFGELAEPMLVTVAVGLVSTALATVLAVPLGLLAARNTAPARWVATTTRVSLVGWRAVPELIIAVIFVAAMGLGPVGGTLALAVGAVPFLAKLVADAVEEVDPGPRQAVLATGASRLQETATSVLPPALPAIAGHVLYLLDVNIRTSTILGIVGGGGIGFLLFNSLRVLHFDVTGAILVMIFCTVYALERLSGWIRKLLL